MLRHVELDYVAPGRYNLPVGITPRCAQNEGEGGDDTLVLLHPAGRMGAFVLKHGKDFSIKGRQVLVKNAIGGDGVTLVFLAKDDDAILEDGDEGPGASEWAVSLAEAIQDPESPLHLAVRQVAAGIVTESIELMREAALFSSETAEPEDRIEPLPPAVASAAASAAARAGQAGHAGRTRDGQE